jgi:membrane-associated phospholipid phosphatase
MDMDGLYLTTSNTEKLGRPVAAFFMRPYQARRPDVSYLRLPSGDQTMQAPEIMRSIQRTLLLLLLSLPALIQAQVPASQDTVATSTAGPTKAREKFPWKGLIVPAALTGYGFAAIHSGSLQQVNKDIQKSIWFDNPHGQVKLDDYFRFVPAVAVYGLNLAGVKGKNDLRDRTLLLTLSAIIMGGTTYTLKHTIKEPSLGNPDSLAYNYFPSGHTATAFMAAEFMWQEYHERSPWYGVAGYAFAAATGYLRLYNNQHWFSDVVAGAGIGIGSTKLAYWIYPKIKRALFKDKKMNAMILPYYRANAFGMQFVSRF